MVELDEPGLLHIFVKCAVTLALDLHSPPGLTTFAFDAFNSCV